MSIFNELLPKLFEISKSSEKSINDELQVQKTIIYIMVSLFCYLSYFFVIFMIIHNLNNLFGVLKPIGKSFSNVSCGFQAALKYLDKLADAYENGRGNIREKTFRNKTRITALQSINEDDGKQILPQHPYKINV